MERTLSETIGQRPTKEGTLPSGVGWTVTKDGLTLKNYTGDDYISLTLEDLEALSSVIEQLLYSRGLKK